MPVADSSVARLTKRFDLDLDDDIDEDEDDEHEWRDDDDQGGDDEDDSEYDEDDEEPETWQVAFTPDRAEYSERGRSACESPKGRLDLTFRPLTA